MKKLIAFITAFIAMNILLFFFALKKPANESFPISGYFIHFIALFSVSIIAYLILSHKLINLKHPLIEVFAYSLMIAIFLEFMQKLLTSYRTFDILDIIAGALGSLTFCLSLYVYNHIRSWTL